MEGPVVSLVTCQTLVLVPWIPYFIGDLRYTDSVIPSALIKYNTSRKRDPGGVVEPEVGLVLAFPLIYPSLEGWEVPL